MMKTAVRYISRSGNTEKIAQAIAQAAGTEAKTAEQPLEEAVEVLFIGGAIYAGKIDGRLKEFLNVLKPEQAGNVVIFSTAAGPSTAHSKLKDGLKAKGFQVAEETYHCRGKFLLANKGKPDEKDMEKAMMFAKGFL